MSLLMSYSCRWNENGRACLSNTRPPARSPCWGQLKLLPTVFTLSVTIVVLLGQKICATSACRDEKSTPQHPVVSLQYCCRTNCNKSYFCMNMVGQRSVNSLHTIYEQSWSTVCPVGPDNAILDHSSEQCACSMVLLLYPGRCRQVWAGLNLAVIRVGFGTTFMFPLDCPIFLPCFFLLFFFFFLHVYTFLLNYAFLDLPTRRGQ